MTTPARNCPGCGAALKASDTSCPFCGHALGSEASAEGYRAPPPPPSQPLAPPPPPDASHDFDSVATEPPPWERRRQVGFWAALWLTWRDSVFRPVRFFRRLPPRGGYGSALSYAVLITATGLLFSLYWEVVEGVLSGAEGPASLVGLLGSLFASLIGLLFVIPLYVGFLFAAVAIVHVGFLVVRSGRRGYEGTFRAFTYAAGPGAFALFPFFGPGLSAVWGMVLIYIAVREIQRTTNARAALAFLVPLLGLMAFVVFLAAVFELLLRTTEFGQPL